MSVIDDNLSGLRDRVRRWLHEVNKDTSFWSNTFIDQMINVSYRRRCVELVMAYEGYFTNVATRDLVADQSRYIWPPGFERCTKMEIVRRDGSTVPVERNERHYSTNYSNAGGASDSYLPNFRPIAGGFVFEPTPKETVTDGIRIEYFGLPTVMQNDGDTMHADFPRSLDELVVLDAAVACLDSEGLLETGAVRSIQRMRAEWELTWGRYIDNKIISTNKIHPFAPHYGDA